MKRLLCFLTIINIVFLSACGVYTDYRDLDGLIIIESMGADFKNGGYELSFASAASSSNPVRISTAGSSVNDAMQKARTASVDGELFFSHLDTIIIGEDSAKEGIYPITEFICRSPIIRIDADLFISGGEAADTVKDTGDDNAGIAEQLNRLHEAAENGHEARIYPVSEIINRTEKYGASLVFALKKIPAEDDVNAVIPDGYAIMKDYELVGQISPELTLAAELLDNRCYLTTLKLPSGTVQIESGKTDFELLYSNGEPDVINVSAKVSASLLENPNDTDTEVLLAQLEQRMAKEIRSVLQLSKDTEADFLALSYKAGEKRLNKSLPYLKFTVTVSAEFKHGNDISD